VYANTDNGSCIFKVVTDTIKGCLDKAAKNYNPLAAASDGSCVYSGASISGCTSKMALNFNANATVDDESCIFARPVNMVVPKIDTIAVQVKDTVAKLVESACSFDFTTPIDTVYILSKTPISGSDVAVEWAIVQGLNITKITQTYSIDKTGSNLLYLSLVCNSTGVPTPSSKYAKSMTSTQGTESVKGVTVSAVVENSGVATEGVSPSGATVTGAIKVFPIPAKDHLNVTLNSENDGTIQLNVYTLEGVKVLALNEGVKEGHNHVVINTTGLNGGFYVLTIIKGGDVLKTVKFAKQ
jgi:hypothetical protein